MAMPGETEAGSAGKQLCRGIARRAHRDDDHGRGNELLAPTLHPIGSKDPDALKIPARRAASSPPRSARSPVSAEPAHLWAETHFLVGQSHFSVEQEKIEGDVTLLFDVGSFEVIIKRVHEMQQDLSA